MCIAALHQPYQYAPALPCLFSLCCHSLAIPAFKFPPQLHCFSSIAHLLIMATPYTVVPALPPFITSSLPYPALLCPALPYSALLCSPLPFPALLCPTLLCSADKLKLTCALGIPKSQLEGILTDAERILASAKYYVNYHPKASWKLLTGELYYKNEFSAAMKSKSYMLTGNIKFLASYSYMLWFTIQLFSSSESCP